jgi:DNA polymerase III epsilon subunit-like protein
MPLPGDYPVRTAPVVFFDLETTGLRPDRGARITEIAIVGANGIQYDWRSPDDSSSDTAVGSELPVVRDHLQEGVVVGHNLQFDFRFLTYELRRLSESNLSGIDLQFADTLRLARELLPHRDDYQLGPLLRTVDAPPTEELHTAVGDALATRTLFWSLVERERLKTLSDVGVKRLSWNAG